MARKFYVVKDSSGNGYEGGYFASFYNYQSERYGAYGYPRDYGFKNIYEMNNIKKYRTYKAAQNKIEKIKSCSWNYNNLIIEEWEDIKIRFNEWDGKPLCGNVIISPDYKVVEIDGYSHTANQELVIRDNEWEKEFKKSHYRTAGEFLQSKGYTTVHIGTFLGMRQIIKIGDGVDYDTIYKILDCPHFKLENKSMSILEEHHTSIYDDDSVWKEFQIWETNKSKEIEEVEKYKDEEEEC